MENTPQIARPEIVYDNIDETNYVEWQYAAIATTRDVNDLENKARGAFVKEKRQPDLIRIADVQELQVGDRNVHYALAISYYSK